MIKTLEETISERNWRVAREQRERDHPRRRASPKPAQAPTADGEYAIYLLDADGAVVSWNAGAETFKNHLPRSYAGQDVARLYPEAERQARRPQHALALARQKGRFEEYGWRLRADGSRFRARIIIDLIKNTQGEAAGFIKVIRDVSALHATELRLQDLHTANRELEQFIHIASHDLREPLRKLQTFNSLLRSEEGDSLSESARGYLDNMMSATARMQELLSSLLLLTRVSSQGQAFEPVELDDLLDDVRADLAMLIKESGARIRVEPLGQIEGDPAQLRQLFQNLISNAIKYARPGQTPDIVVSQSDAHGDDQRVLVVQDNGIGFDPEHRERIFGIFQRLHGRGRYEGTGVGLSICRKICERHGGQITAASQPGEGARFTIVLPVSQTTDDGASRPQAGQDG